jgi:hypothetical protein
MVAKQKRERAAAPHGDALALVDSLREGTLNEAQTETVRQLRTGILALAEWESIIQDVKVQSLGD